MKKYPVICCQTARSEKSELHPNDTKIRIIRRIESALFMGNWKMENGNSPKGFTIMELLLYLGLFSLLLLMLTSIFTATLTSQLSSESVTSVEQDERFILYHLTHDIQSTTGINIADPTLGNSDSQLVMNVNGTTYTYQLTNGNLTLTKSTDGVANSLNSINTTVSNLTFTRLGNTGKANTITVSFTLSSKIQSNTVKSQKSFNTTIATRQ